VSRPIGRTAFVSISVASLTLAAAVSARADWPENGLLVDSVRVNSHIQPIYLPAALPSGGSMLFAGRGHSYYLAHRLDADGNDASGWPVYPPVGDPVPDGTGGFIQFFRHATSEGDAIAARHFLADGSDDPGWPPGGLIVVSVPGTEWPVFASSDGAGGALVAWLDYRDGGYYPDLYTHHVLANGTLAGSVANGTELGPLHSTEMEPFQLAFAPDATGGFFVMWRANDSRIQRLSTALVPLWEAGGVVVPHNARRPKLVADDSHGVYVAYQTSLDGGARSGVFLLRLTRNGSMAFGWPATGVRPASPDQTWPALASDGAGGVYLGWEVPFSYSDPGSGEVRILRVRSDGTIAPGFAAEGLSLSTRERTGQITLASDGEGGALACFAEDLSMYAGIPHRLIAQRVTPGGEIAPGWARDGRVVRTSSYQINAPLLASLGGDDGIVMWWELEPSPDHYSYHDDKVYAQRISASPVTSVPQPGGVASALRLATPMPNPSRGSMRVRFALAGGGDARLELFDVAGRRIEFRDVAALGRGDHEIVLAAGRSLEAGLYLVRLAEGGVERVVRATVMP
jgi:hypothetical protein